MSLPDHRMLPSKIRHAFTAALLGMLLVGLSLAMSCTGPGCGAEDGTSARGWAHLLFSPVEAGSARRTDPAPEQPAPETGDEAITAPVVASSSVIFEETRSTQIRVSRDKIYELLFVSAIEGVDGKDETQPLRLADRQLDEWGARRLASFRVQRSASQDLDAQWVHLLEWPDAEARLLAEDSGLCLSSQVTDTVSRHRSGIFRTSEDGVIRLRTDKVYEFAGLTLHDGVAARASFHRYHQVVTPIQQSYGGSYPRTILDLQPVEGEGHDSYHHARQTLVQWDSIEDADKLRSSADYRRRALPLRARAVRSSDSLITQFVVPR